MGNWRLQAGPLFQEVGVIMIHNDFDFNREDCSEVLRAGRMPDGPEGRQHVDTEYVGRLLQLPTFKTIASNPAQQESELPVSNRSESQS